MSRIYLICGKICSGKTFLSRKMEKELHAVRLSVDEKMLAMNPIGLFGDKHEEIAAQVQAELYEESLRLTYEGIPVILDWGFWTKKDREKVSRFYEEHRTDYEWHYMDISDEQWERNIHYRNDAIRNGEEGGFIVDDGLREKLLSLFEAPSQDEIDVWHTV